MKKRFLKYLVIVLCFLVLIPKISAMQNDKTKDTDYNYEYNEMQERFKKKYEYYCNHSRNGQFKYMSTFLRCVFHNFFRIHNDDVDTIDFLRIDTPRGTVGFSLRNPYPRNDGEERSKKTRYRVKVTDCFVHIPGWFRSDWYRELCPYLDSYYQIDYDYKSLAPYIDNFQGTDKEAVVNEIITYLTMPYDDNVLGGNSLEYYLGENENFSLDDIYDLLNRFSSTVRTIWWANVQQTIRPANPDGNVAVFCGILMIAEPFRFELGEGDALVRSCIRTTRKLLEGKKVISKELDKNFDDSQPDHSNYISEISKSAFSYVFGDKGPDGKPLALIAQKGGKARTRNCMYTSESQSSQNAASVEPSRDDKLRVNAVSEDFSDDEEDYDHNEDEGSDN